MMEKFRVRSVGMMEDEGGCAGERKHVFPDMARKIKSEGPITRCPKPADWRWKGGGLTEICIAIRGKMRENVPVLFHQS